jgi:hypothetical protein
MTPELLEPAQPVVAGPLLGDLAPAMRSISTPGTVTGLPVGSVLMTSPGDAPLRSNGSRRRLLRRSGHRGDLVDCDPAVRQDQVRERSARNIDADAEHTFSAVDRGRR